MIETLIKINGVDVSKIVTYKVNYCKLWSKDTGRSMTGENKGTLIGIFPKLEIQVGSLGSTEMEVLLSLVNRANAMVQYYDPERKTLVSNSFYFGDVAVELRRQRTENFKPVQISVIANKKRV